MKNNSLLTREFIEHINRQLKEIKLNSREVETINKVDILIEYTRNYFDTFFEVIKMLLVVEH